MRTAFRHTLAGQLAAGVEPREAIKQAEEASIQAAPPENRPRLRELQDRHATVLGEQCELGEERASVRSSRPSRAVYGQGYGGPEARDGGDWRQVTVKLEIDAGPNRGRTVEYHDAWGPGASPSDEYKALLLALRMEELDARAAVGKRVTVGVVGEWDRAIGVWRRRIPARKGSDPAERGPMLADVLKSTHRKPTREEVLSIIDDVSRWEGNATINTIRVRLMLAYGWHADPTTEQLQQVLCSLFAEDLIVRDGVRHDGSHYALTFKGRRKLALLRQHRDRAA